jgi:hypothetical protein
MSSAIHTPLPAPQILNTSHEIPPCAVAQRERHKNGLLRNTYIKKPARTAVTPAKDVRTTEKNNLLNPMH